MLSVLPEPPNANKRCIFNKYSIVSSKLNFIANAAVNFILPICSTTTHICEMFLINSHAGVYGFLLLLLMLCMLNGKVA